MTLKRKIMKEEEIYVTLEVFKNQIKYPGGQLSHWLYFNRISSFSIGIQNYSVNNKIILSGFVILKVFYMNPTSRIFYINTTSRIFFT